MAKLTIVGLAVAIIYVLLSVTLAELTKRINSSENWNKPLLTCLFNHIFQIILWPVLMIQASIGKEGTFARNKSLIEKLTADWPPMSPKNSKDWRFSGFIIFLAALLYCATGGWVEALQHASVTDVQALQKLTPIFTIIFAYFLLGDRVSKVKIIAVVISLSGVAVLSFSATRDDSKSMDAWGVIFGSTSAILYALYNVSVKKVFGEALDVNASVLIMFLVGLASLFPVTIVIPLNDFAGLESFAVPTNWSLFCILCLNAFVGVLCNLSNLSSIALNGPVFTTIFATAQIAIAAIVDYLMYHDILTIEEWIGCFCVVIGTLMTVFDSVLSPNGYPQGVGYQKAPESDDGGTTSTISKES